MLITASLQACHDTLLGYAQPSLPDSPSQYDDTQHWAPTILDGYAIYGRPQKPRRTDTRAHLKLLSTPSKDQADSQ